MYFKTVPSFYLREKHCKNCNDQEGKNTLLLSLSLTHFWLPMLKQEKNRRKTLNVTDLEKQLL